MSKTRIPFVKVPSFRDELLNDLANEIAKRARSMKNKADSFRCTRALERHGHERLDLETRTRDDRPTQVKLSIWNDSGIFLGVHKPGDKGWEFAFRATGDIEDLSSTDVVMKYLQTLHLAQGGALSPNDTTLLQELWDEAKLERDA